MMSMKFHLEIDLPLKKCLDSKKLFKNKLGNYIDGRHQQTKLTFDYTCLQGLEQHLHCKHFRN